MLTFLVTLAVVGSIAEWRMYRATGQKTSCIHQFLGQMRRLNVYNQRITLDTKCKIDNPEGWSKKEQLMGAVPPSCGGLLSPWPSGAGAHHHAGVQPGVSHLGVRGVSGE